MIRWMMEQLAHEPGAVFYERDLRDRFPEDLRWGQASRLLRFTDGAPVYVGRDGERRLVVHDLAEPFSVDEDDPDVVFERVVPAETSRWSLDLLSVATRLHEANELDGRAETLGRRLVFVGHRAGTCHLLALADADSVGLLIDPRPPALSTFTEVVVLIAGDLPKASTAEALRRISVRCALVPLMNSLDDAAWRIEITPNRTGANMFRHDDDFSWVAIGEHGHQLSPPRAAVIRRLSQAADMDQHAVQWSELQRIAQGAGGNPASMKDLIGSMNGWERLVQKVGRDGWRLAPDRAPGEPR